MATKGIYENGTYIINNPTWHEEDSPWKARQIVRMLRKNNIDPLTLCEVGCGAGGILKCLADEYGDKAVFSGYEFSPKAFEISKTKTKHNLKFYNKDLFCEKEVTFEVVMAIDVIEHVEDYLGFLRKLKTKGVYKVFHIPLDLSVSSVLRGSPILNSRLLVGHIHYFTKETALATLKDAGYEVLDYFYTSGSLELQNREWKTNLLVPLRRLLFFIHQDLAARVLGGFSLMVLAK